MQQQANDTLPESLYVEVVFPLNDVRCCGDIGLVGAKLSIRDAIVDVNRDHRELCICLLCYAREKESNKV